MSFEEHREWVELTCEELTDSELRVSLLNASIDCIRQYVQLSPSPHAALLNVMDGALSVFSEDWALSRNQLLDYLRDPL